MRFTFFNIFMLSFIGLLAGSPDTQADFPNPDPNYVFSFPRDHGNHPEFKIEWWYLVGHLYDQAGQRYGFQATFFRNREHPPSSEQPDHSITFGNTHIYMAHMAWVDESAQTHIHEERFNRDGWNAHSSTETLDIRNGNWTFKLEHNAQGQEVFHLSSSIEADLQLQLRLTPNKPRILFGENGIPISIKGDEPDARSYYISYSRLETSGTVKQNGKTLELTGTAWMDHEISSNQLGSEIAGWDWVCIQFEDNREIKAYRLRTSDGTMSKHSRLIWIDEDCHLHYQSPDAYQWIEKGYWQSAKTGGRYPTTVELTTTDPQDGKQRTLTIEPIYSSQEIVGQGSDIHYWEGACRVFDETGDVVGKAYLELTGYARALNE